MVLNECSCSRSLGIVLTDLPRRERLLTAYPGLTIHIVAAWTLNMLLCLLVTWHVKSRGFIKVQLYGYLYFVCYLVVGTPYMAALHSVAFQTDVGGLD
jgi:hypothetical protein